MKKIIVLLLAVVALQQVHAQKSELSVSYGIPTNKNLESDFGDAFVNAATGGLIDNETFTGSFNLEYMYRLDKRWAIGVDLGYEQSSYDVNINKSVNAKAKDNYIIAMVGAKYYWTNGSMFRMYAKASIGASFMTEKLTDVKDPTLKADNQTEFAYQVSPIAFEVGKNFCGFLELGYGNQGIAQAGIRVRF